MENEPIPASKGQRDVPTSSTCSKSLGTQGRSPLGMGDESQDRVRLSLELLAPQFWQSLMVYRGLMELGRQVSGCMMNELKDGCMK